MLVHLDKSKVEVKGQSSRS